MTTQEERAMKMLGATEEGFRKIQEAFKLFPGLWDDLAFVEMWQSIPDDACSALLNAVDKIASLEDSLKEVIRKQNGVITELHTKLDKCAERLVYEYAENGSETTKEVGINAVGANEFYAMLLEGGYDLNEYDREDIAELLREEDRP